MKTIGWWIFQIPLLTEFRICFCWKRSLHHCAAGTGWRLFGLGTLRMLLLVLWGMGKIDYSLPQTAEKIIGIYVEVGMLGIQVLDGMVAIMSSWFENIRMIYPTVIIIPICFIIDFVVKATCYGPLFLWPQVTAFGVFSLIEVWFRNFSLVYCWIAIVSFIYLSKGKKNPFSEDEGSPLTRKRSSVRSPFSRSSTLSIRGRRSFLLKKQTENSERSSILNEAETTLEKRSADSNQADSSAEGDDRSTLLSRDEYSDVNNQSTVRSPDLSLQRHSELAAPPSQPRYKRVGGFVPEVLRVPSNATEASSVGHASRIKQPSHVKAKVPSLPLQPPIGLPRSRDTWRKPTHKSTTSQADMLPVLKQDQSFFV